MVRCTLYNNYVMKFVSDLRQVGGFLRVPPPIKVDRHGITEILLTVVVNTINVTFSSNRTVVDGFNTTILIQ